MAFLAGMAAKQLAQKVGQKAVQKIGQKALKQVANKVMKRKGASGSSNQDSPQEGGPTQSGPMQSGPMQSAAPATAPAAGVTINQTVPITNNGLPTQQSMQPSMQPSMSMQQKEEDPKSYNIAPPYVVESKVDQPKVVQTTKLQGVARNMMAKKPALASLATKLSLPKKVPLKGGQSNNERANYSGGGGEEPIPSGGGDEEPIPSGGGEARTFFSKLIGKFFTLLTIMWKPISKLSIFSKILLQERNGGKYNRALHYTNMFPGLLTCGIVIFLILFILWNAIQQVLKKISFNLINLPDLPFSLNKNIMQLVYSSFYIITSGYLLFYIFFSYFNELSDDIETGGTLSNLDIVVIMKRIVRALYILWPISVILIGSTIAKALYKMSCGGAKANIAPFGKVIDSTIVISLIASVCLIILLKIKYVIDMLMRSTNSQTTVKSEKILAIIFNFTLIYFILRLITITFEEFASKELIFLLGRSVNEASGSAGNCVSDSSECPEKNSSDSAKHYVTAVFLCILAVMIIAINMKFFKVGHQVGTVLQRSLTNASDLIEKNPVTQTTK
jgi:hypothetical protein